MPYTPTTWVDTVTPATAANMNHIETGIADVDQRVYNVRASKYGAKGDGVTDDGAAIRSACSDIQAAGGGTLYFPPGTYLASVGQNPENNAYLAMAFLPGNTRVMGAGINATIIKLAGSQVACHGLMNWHIQSAGDENITISDLTLDGNAQNQSLAAGNADHGLKLLRVRNLRCYSVRFKDWYGTANSGGGEGFSTTFDLSTDAIYVGCECVGTTANTAVGFSANQSTNLVYVGCSAHGMGNSHGFTMSECTNVKYSDCSSYGNGTVGTSYGFNSELSAFVRYSNCISGGYASLLNSYPYNDGQRLGNSSHGFVVLGGTATLPNPQFAPTLTPLASGGSLAAGVWTVAFTYQTSGGETQVGPTAQATTTGASGSITVAIPALPPDAATGWNIYVSSVVNGATLLKSNGSLQTGLTYTITTAGAGAAVPGSNTATYTVTVDVQWSNCSALYNGGSGLFLSTVTSGFTRLNWIGGDLLGNGVYGAVGGAGDQIAITGHPAISGNTNADLHSGGTDHAAYGSLPAPGVPASGTELLNPYWIPVLVFVSGGTLTTPFISIGKTGAEVQVAAGTNVAIPLAPGEYIKLTYSVAPSWIWVSEL